MLKESNLKNSEIKEYIENINYNYDKQAIFRRTNKNKIKKVS